MSTSFTHKASHNASLRKVKFDNHTTSYKFNEILFGFFKVQKFFSNKEIFSFSSSHQDNALSSVDDSLLILSRSSFEKPLSEYIYICPTGNIHKPNKDTARRISEEGVGRNTQQVPK